MTTGPFVVAGGAGCGELVKELGTVEEGALVSRRGVPPSIEQFGEDFKVQSVVCALCLPGPRLVMGWNPVAGWPASPVLLAAFGFGEDRYALSMPGKLVA